MARCSRSGPPQQRAVQEVSRQRRTVPTPRRMFARRVYALKPGAPPVAAPHNSTGRHSCSLQSSGGKECLWLLQCFRRRCGADPQWWQRQAPSASSTGAALNVSTCRVLATPDLCASHLLRRVWAVSECWSALPVLWAWAPGMQLLAVLSHTGLVEAARVGWCGQTNAGQTDRGGQPPAQGGVMIDLLPGVCLLGHVFGSSGVGRLSRYTVASDVQYAAVCVGAGVGWPLHTHPSAQEQPGSQQHINVCPESVIAGSLCDTRRHQLQKGACAYGCACCCGGAWRDQYWWEPHTG